MQTLTKTLITSLLLGLSLHTWADEAINHNYVEFNATQIDKSTSYDLYGCGIESQYVITDNIYLHGVYNQYSNSDRNISDYRLGFGAWIEPTDKITITGYSMFRKTNIEINDDFGEVDFNTTSDLVGAEVKYDLFESLSLLSQFDINNIKIRWRSNDSDATEIFKDNVTFRRFGIGIKGRLKNFSYEIIRNSYHSNNELFRQEKTLITKISYHFTEKFSLGINRESTDKNIMYQLVGRYIL